MQSDLLVEPARSEAKRLLKDYIELRSGLREPSGLGIEQDVIDLIRISEQIQQELWLLAVGSNGQLKKGQVESEKISPFMGSVIALIDIHYTRVHSAVMNRIPLTIWMTLYLMAALSMIIMGFQAGLTERRSPVATITLAVAFSAVIILITDLDRPIMSFFDINKQLLVDLYQYMETSLSLQYYPGD